MHWLEITVSVLASLALAPVAFFFECFPCCEGCGVADGKPRTDPANEGTWVPSGTWLGVGGVTWTFVANPGDDSGETWFFFGSASTSKVGGGASTTEQRDWWNICNWYSNKTTSPEDNSNLTTVLNKRATRLPPENAVVHLYGFVDTSRLGPATVKNAYQWAGRFVSTAEATTTSAAHDGPYGFVFSGGNQGVVNGGAMFVNNFTGFENDTTAVVNGGSVFYTGQNAGTLNDGATFNDLSENSATVNGGATFNDSSNNSATVNGGATFNDTSRNFNPFLAAAATVNDGAVFNGGSDNVGTVNGGATFNDSSRNLSGGTVNGGATFNDAACSERTTGNFFSSPCDRKFVAHPTDLPTCNGTAPDGCANSADTCGCG